MNSMTDGTNPVIEACPFCGGEAVLADPHGAFSRLAAVYCEACEIKGPLMANADKAIAAWNTRAAPPANPVIVERVARALCQFEVEALTYEPCRPSPEFMWRWHSERFCKQAQAALEAMPDVVGLREALELARNRLRAAAINAPHNSREGYEYSEWADEANAVLAKVSGVSE